MIYLTGITQDWFEIALNQKEQEIFHDWFQN